VKAADIGTVASDGGSGVLILRGVTGRLFSKSAQPNKVPLASKTSTDSAGTLYRGGLPRDDAPLDESAPTKHAATDLEERSAPTPAEKAALVSSGYELSEPTWCCFVVI
jgi:hypothetical protein